MLNGLLCGSILTLFLRHLSHEERAGPKPRESRPLAPSAVIKIVHAGGIVEHYYMAVLASRVMEKYPYFILARQEIFRRPWESVVRPEEILVPGEKFYVIPRRTVRKLRRRIRPRSGELWSKRFGGQDSDVSDGHDSADRSKDGCSSSSGGIKSEDKSSAKAARPLGKKHGTDMTRVTSGLPSRRTPKKTDTWEPTLSVISES